MRRFDSLTLTIATALLTAAGASGDAPEPIRVTEDANRIVISTPHLEAVVNKKANADGPRPSPDAPPAYRTSYAVSGVAQGSFLDRATGFRDAGFGLDIVDWLLESGSDEAYRDQLAADPAHKELIYQFNNAYHGKTAKRAIEGPQICTKAKEVEPKVIRGTNADGEAFVAVVTRWQYRTAAPGKKAGSTWTQTLIFPAGRRYFLSADHIDTINASDGEFLRLDMPGHINHGKSAAKGAAGGETFSEIYLSYATNDRPDPPGGEAGLLPAASFAADFPPDERNNYTRGQSPLPKRFIRAYHLRDSRTGAAGPWLAGMTLDPAMVSEAWCHQRGYVCLIEEIGGRPVKPGDSFGAAFVVGYFDGVEEMKRAYDQYAGGRGLEVDEKGWRVTE